MQTEQVADENKESPLPGLMAGKNFSDSHDKRSLFNIKLWDCGHSIILHTNNFVDHQSIDSIWEDVLSMIKALSCVAW